MRKLILALSCSAMLPLTMTACSTNPATGRQQFTGLLSPQQEKSVTAQEHEKIVQQYGLYDNPQVVSYVKSIGSRVAADTERSDVEYQFFVIDSPIVNAFALPGGYIYVSRGLLALANSEAELAGVLAHEVGHVTGRHAADRYSRSVVTALGANVLSVVLDSSGASQALGLGANLYLSGYSRGQENEADSLGLRYMTQAGYDADALPAFLSSLSANDGLQARIDGKSNKAPAYLSTHPQTADRVNSTAVQARNYQQGDVVNHEGYLRMIDGLPYGDSEDQGFVRGSEFYHTKLGFTYSVPSNHTITNQPAAVVSQGTDGSILIFDMAKRTAGNSVTQYVRDIWMKGKTTSPVEQISISGMNAATMQTTGTANGKSVNVQLIAIEFAPDRYARFQVLMPQGASQSIIDALKSATYSFRKLSSSEANNLRPYRIDVVTASSGDTAQSLAAKMPFGQTNLDRFVVLNGLLPNEAIKAGRMYKIVR